MRAGTVEGARGEGGTITQWKQESEQKRKLEQQQQQQLNKEDGEAPFVD